MSDVHGGPPHPAVSDVSTVPPAATDASVGTLEPTPLVAVVTVLVLFLVLAYYWRQTTE